MKCKGCGVGSEWAEKIGRSYQYICTACGKYRPAPKPKRDSDNIKEVHNVTIEKYSTKLKESHQPPSKGGVTDALHLHMMLVEGEWYTWFALGSQQWVHQNDTVSFSYELKDNRYRNVIKATIKTKDKDGGEVERGNRGYKTKLRTP